MKTTLLLLLGCTLLSHALPREARIPGGIAILELPANAERAIYQNKPVMVYRGKAIVGIDLKAKSGVHYLNVSGKRGERVAFEVKTHAYPESRVTISDTAKVTPPPSYYERIGREGKEILGAYAIWDDNTPNLDLQLPAQGPYSSEFGLKRFFNDQPRSPHSGLDIAASTGDPVYASDAGTVVVVGDYFFNGKTVMLHHGGGLVTLYCHMSTIEVEKSARVTQGQIIGEVGASGRASGPHLHWSVSLNGKRVDPLLFIQQ